MAFNPDKEYKSVWETVTTRQPPRTKIWKGRRRTARRHRSYNWDSYSKLIKIQVGDYIGTCEGFNRKIHKIEREWVKITNQTWILNEIVFTDARGRTHFASGMGCACLPYTHEEIIDDVLVWCSDQSLAEWAFIPYLLKLKELYDKTGTFLNEHGEPLIEQSKDHEDH